MHTPSSSPQIRRAGPSDAQAVAAILTETYLTTWQPQLTPEAAMRFAQCDKIGDYVRSRLAEFHLACVNGTVAGMVDWENDFVWALHVSPRWQARGVGSTLLAHAEAAMAAAGHRQARLETDTFNAGSRAFYQRHGYAEVEFYPDESWHSGFTTVLLSKPLDPA
ncbi:GNAT family N-acetyltransferase [Cupriavidus basilensis]|uniref:GNAT family N-acetyltransferase n=1 Tax=Cupriavidus basilensis TaxID=68895 RepID=UPI0023E89A1D|nr:GNAT family N-acetyltransferase [Cupriavidus basilensis]MDF3882485.1 GNAT family N-acetyltransferase [Cupriavidus basilensis]